MNKITRILKIINNVKNQVWHQVRNQVGNQILNNAWDQVRIQVKSRDKIWNHNRSDVKP